jgi:hypothetical protein
MLEFEPVVVAWCLACVQVVGLASAWLARLSARSTRQASCERLFFCCLALVGMVTMVAFSLGAGAFLISGTTLSIMVLTTTWDFGGARRVAASQ